MRRPAQVIRAPRRPAPTIRLRLTALYGVVFLITGAVLLTLGYLLVRHNLNAHPDFAQVRARLQQLGAGPSVIVPGVHPFSWLFRFTPGSPERRLATAVGAEIRSNALHRLLIEYLIALGGMTVVSVGAGWLLAGRALRPLRRITATAQRVSGENLGERIALTGPADELRELADTFDLMLGRLEAAFESQRHFVANASHELRTPLAIMRTEVDVALADPDAGPEDLRRMGEAVRDTIDRTERLIEALLTLARSEAASGREESVNLAGLAADCITDLRARAEEGEVEVAADLAPAWTRGEPALLERMIANLVDNAIRYNRPGGLLEVRTEARQATVRLEVRNDGAQVGSDEAERLTEPFHRLAQEHGGFGLGLSIVASVVRAHRGKIRVTARKEGGLAVSIELPLEHAAPSVRAAKESAALTKS
jgi:signal transduction histidine kinase